MLGDGAIDLVEIPTPYPDAIAKVQRALRGAAVTAAATISGEIAPALRDLVDVAFVPGGARVLRARRPGLRQVRAGGAGFGAAARYHQCHQPGQACAREIVHATTIADRQAALYYKG